MGLALLRADDLTSGDSERVARAYREFSDYTAWFQRSFNSTLCRERISVDLNSGRGLAGYVLKGRAFTICLAQAGQAERYLRMKAPDYPCALEGGAEFGICAAPVLAGIRKDTGLGSPLLETVSSSLDGGVGLSGGLCGALAGALLVLGLSRGIDPGREGIGGTLRFSLAGLKKGGTGPWSEGRRLLRSFSSEFGSLECRDIAGRTFESSVELTRFLRGSARCMKVIGWCREEGAAFA